MLSKVICCRGVRKHLFWRKGQTFLIYTLQDGTVIEPNPSTGKYEIQEKVTDTIHYENVLLVKNVKKSDYGVYTCIVTNEKGDARFSILFDETSKTYFIVFPFFVFTNNSKYNFILMLTLFNIQQICSNDFESIPAKIR